MSAFDWSDIGEVPDDIRELTGPISAGTPRLADVCVRWGSLANPMLDKLEQINADPQAYRGAPSGFPELDAMTNGFQRGRFYLAAALTGAGKSVLLGDFFRAWIRASVPCCMVTLEMGRDEVWLRQAAAWCKIDHARLQSGDLTDDDWTKLARWVGETAEAPAWICDKPSATVADLTELIAEGAAVNDWQAVVVDYAQIIRHRASTRERAVAEIAAGLKEIARTADVAVVVGAQLNREANRRPGGRPQLSDLRESAALEHEADVAVLIHRPDYTDPKSERVGEADLIVDKNRGGPKGTFTVAAQMQWQRFVPFAAEDMTPCVSCFVRHPGPAGSLCRTCKPQRGKGGPP